MNREVELRHLTERHLADRDADGVGLVELIVSTRRSPQHLIDRCREVLIAVVSTPPEPWPSNDQWAGLLPPWFVDGCAAEESEEDSEQWLAWWRTLSHEDQFAASEAAQWSLADWIHWFQPDERQWYWFDGRVIDESRAAVQVELDGWPAPLGSLKWLLRVAGAQNVEVSGQLL
jgi:hypothetical protein